MLKRHVSSIIVMVVSIVLTVAIFSILLGVPYCLKYVPIVQYLPKLIYTSDPTAAANMYMVFSALLVAVLAIALTLTGIWISIEIAKQKELVMRENVDDIVKQLADSEEHAKALVLALAEKGPLRAHIDAVVAEKTKAVRQDVTKNVLVDIGKQIASLEADIKRLSEDRYKPAASDIKKDLGGS